MFLAALVALYLYMGLIEMVIMDEIVIMVEIFITVKERQERQDRQDRQN